MFKWTADVCDGLHVADDPSAPGSDDPFKGSIQSVMCLALTEFLLLQTENKRLTCKEQNGNANFSFAGVQLSTKTSRSNLTVRMSDANASVCSAGV